MADTPSLIALFGATGGTGRQVLAQALEQGHRVRALVRGDTSRLGDAEGLQVIAGDVLDPSAVDRCIEGADAVICALGTKPGAEPIEDRGTEQILAAMQRAGVHRLVVVSSLGVGDSVDQVPAFFRLLMRFTLRRIMEAKERQERAVMASGLDWTIVRPGGLTDGPRTGSYKAGTDKTITATRVSRADVAEFVLKQVGDNTYLRRAPAIS